MIVKDIGLTAALWGGFSSFFSIWQLCLMQITPFFFAYAVGLYLLESNGALRRLLLSICGYILGFTFVFSVMEVPGFGMAGYIIYNLEDFRKAAAVYVTIIALLMALYHIYNTRIPQTALLTCCLPAGMFLGASFAVAYSPCITPGMSDIMNFSARPANAARGFQLFTVYGFGLTSAFAISGIALSIGVERIVNRRTSRSAVVYMSSAVLLVMALLLTTDMILAYKSVLVGVVLD